MAGKVLNIKVCSPLKLHHGLTGKYHATCHYSYNLPLPPIFDSQSNRVMIKNCKFEKKMKVERINNEFIVRFSPGTKTSKIQSILDYLRYEELTSQSNATEEDVDKLTKQAKKGRWERIKRDLGLDE